jgi:LysM repeat protein
MVISNRVPAILLALFMLCYLNQTTAQQKAIYVYQDAACMDRYEYEVSGNGTLQGAIHYHLSTSDTEQLILQVPKRPEGYIEWLAQAPAYIWACQLQVDSMEQLVQAINKAEIEIYLVEKFMGRYCIMRVESAAYMNLNAGIVRYYDSNYDLAYDNMADLPANADYRISTKAAAVYHDKNSELKCYNVHHFRVYEQDVLSYKDITLVPGVGITAITKAGQTQWLKQVESYNLEDYLAARCEGTVLKRSSAGARPELLSQWGKPTKDIAQLPRPDSATVKPISAPTLYLEPVVSNVISPAPSKTLVKHQGPLPQLHTVTNGESLHSIAQYYNIPLAQLKKQNRMLGDRIYVNQKLYIQAPDDFVAKGAMEIPQSYETGATTGDGCTYVYKVREGDNLYRLAVKNQTTVDALMALNNLNSINLKIEQKLRIPICPGSNNGASVSAR